MWQDFWVISNYATTTDNTSTFYLILYTKDSGDLHIRSDTDIKNLAKDKNVEDSDITPELLDELKFWELIITFKKNTLSEVTLSYNTIIEITEDNRVDEYDEVGELKLNNEVYYNSSSNKKINEINEILKKHNITQIKAASSVKNADLVNNCNVVNNIQKTYAKITNDPLDKPQLKPLFDLLAPLQEVKTTNRVFKKIENRPPINKAIDKALGSRDIQHEILGFLGKPSSKTKSKPSKGGKRKTQRRKTQRRKTQRRRHKRK
jgi:hypothetical protein